MASVTKRKWAKPDGSVGEAWQVRYLDPTTGTAPAKTFKLKKEADAFKRKVERELEEGSHITRSASRTVAQLLDEYLAYIDRRADDGQVSGAYPSSQRRALRYAKEDLGHVLLTELTWQQVEAHAKRLRLRTSEIFKRRLASGTIAHAVNSLSRAVGWGVRRGYAIRNVVPDALKELGPTPMARIKTFSQAEMQGIVAAIENRPRGIARRSQALMRAVVYLGAMCGMRRGEILGLRWSVIDFERGLITIDRSLTNRDELKGTKTAAGIRVVPMPRMVASALESWRPFATVDDRGLIFRSSGGGQITDNMFYTSYWHPLLRRAELPPVDNKHRHFHATRHFAGSAWLDAGVPLPEVSRLLGHANVGVTAKVYSHAITEVHHRASVLDHCAIVLTRTEPLQLTHDVRIAA